MDLWDQLSTIQTCDQFATKTFLIDLLTALHMVTPQTFFFGDLAWERPRVRPRAYKKVMCVKTRGKPARISFSVWTSATYTADVGGTCESLCGSANTRTVCKPDPTRDRNC